MRYEEMTLELSGAMVRAEDDRRVGRYRVRVLQSPAGEMTPEQAVPVEYDDRDLQRILDRLERRQLDRSGLVGLGRTLAALLLPTTPADGAPGVRDLFALSRAQIGRDDGLRVRLRVPPELSVIPWEYIFVDREGADAMDGFLALDPRVSIVRHEALAMPVDRPKLAGDIKVVTALASPDGLPELDLDAESKLVADALDRIPGIRVEPCRKATLDKLQPLLPGAGIFHFAGHGEFARTMGARPGTYKGTGSLAFQDALVDAEQAGINLRGHGVRVAVLAGCHTAHRDGFSVWSGIAPALVRAEVPAVVANQYSVLDVCAVAFTRAFYQALAGGLPIDRAVTAGRIAAYNKDRDGRDWGVAVLYLRAGDGQLFEGASNPKAREVVQDEAEADVRVRAGEIKAGGVLVGAKAERVLEGKLSVTVNVGGTVLGDVTGANVRSLDGGAVNIGVDVGDVGPGGSVHGAVIGDIGSGLLKGRPKAGAKKRAAKPAVSTNVGVGTVSGGQVIGGVNASGGQVIIIGGPQSQPAGDATPGREDESIEEKIRLDVALPSAVAIGEPFDLMVAVRQPDSEPLAVPDLDLVESAHGSIFRAEEDEVVKYRVEVRGVGFQASPPSYLFKLRTGENSRPVAFQVVASRAGKCSLYVDAYQEDGALAAQTRLVVEVKVGVRPA